LCVPLDAVDGIGTASQQVYVVRDGTLRLTRVTIGIETPTRIEIVTGLRSGDQVVVGRRSGLYDGQRVVARTASYEQS
jgi:multidrug efflux pump subunit AcrA (membrane-fusion protein)